VTGPAFQRPKQLVRFSDLEAARIVKNWPQLKRLQAEYGFPAGFLIGRKRVWYEDEVEAWVQTQRDRAR